MAKPLAGRGMAIHWPNRQAVHQLRVHFLRLRPCPRRPSSAPARPCKGPCPTSALLRPKTAAERVWGRTGDAEASFAGRRAASRELLKGPLYYACAITLTTIVFWRTSPISIAVICNLCAGDGVADIFGRRFGHVKLPHNREKSYAGSIAMFLAGFIASVLFMCYFNIFGFVEKSWTMVAAFGIISLVAAVVESLPISTRLDDNLTVPVASVLFGALVFYSIGARNLCCMSSENRRSISATVGMVFAGSSSS